MSARAGELILLLEVVPARAELADPRSCRTAFTHGLCVEMLVLSVPHSLGSAFWAAVTLPTKVPHITIGGARCKGPE